MNVGSISCTRQGQHSVPRRGGAFMRFATVKVATLITCVKRAVGEQRSPFRSTNTSDILLPNVKLRPTNAMPRPSQNAFLVLDMPLKVKEDVEILTFA